MGFGSPDRVAQGDYFSYEATRRRWESEGLPKDADLNGYFGMDFDPFRWCVPVTYSVIPSFDEEVVEETPRATVIRRRNGETVRILKDAEPPAMPQWVKYPVSTGEEWRAFRRRLDPLDPRRVKTEEVQAAGDLQASGVPVGMWIGSTYGHMRNWWGVEALSLLFYDAPALIAEMVELCTALVLAALERVLSSGITLDWVMLWEDMAYKTGPLVSPRLYAKHCGQFYRAVMDKVSSAGVPVVMLDSDGDVRSLIPFWLDHGVTVMHPLEAAAGMDPAELRRTYGKQLGFFGGIDKRALAGTREGIRREALPKLDACLAEGGFIPACDHAVPPDVSFDNYRFFRDLVRERGERV